MLDARSGIPITVFTVVTITIIIIIIRSIPPPLPIGAPVLVPSRTPGPALAPAPSPVRAPAPVGTPAPAPAPFRAPAPGPAPSPARAPTSGGGLDWAKIGKDIATDPLTWATIGTAVTLQLVFEAIESKARGKAVEKATQKATQKAAQKATQTATQKAAARVAATAVKTSERLTEKLLLKLVTSDGTRLLEKIGIKVVERSAERAAIKAATKLGAKAAAAGTTGPAAPFVAAAEVAFSLITGYMDSFNLGGFQNLTTMSFLNANRDAINSATKAAFEEAGLPLPLLYGPLDKMSNTVVETETVAACNNLIASETARVTALMTTDQTAAGLLATEMARVDALMAADPRAKELLDNETARVSTLMATDPNAPQFASFTVNPANPTQTEIEAFSTAYANYSATIRDDTAYTDYRNTFTDTTAYEDYFNSLMGIDTLYDKAYEQVCKTHSGVTVKHPVTGNVACTWNTAAGCKATWPQTETDNTYYEFDTSNAWCEVKPALMRTKCEALGDGVTYNMETGTCNLTDAYCRRYGVSGGLTNGDCVINDSQKMAEMIFGTTFVRGLVTIFDMKNYKSCPPGSREPKELAMFVGLGTLINPEAPSLGNMMCATQKCGDNEQMQNTMCYPKCDTGYQTTNAAQGMCYKCPEGYSVSTGGMCAKSGCGDNEEQNGAFCYPKCTDKFGPEWKDNNGASICMKDCEGGLAPGSDPIGQYFCKRDPKTITDLGKDSTCQGDWAEGTAGMCAKKCDDGYQLGPGNRCFHPKADTANLIPPYSRKSCTDMGLGSDWTQSALYCTLLADTKTEVGKPADCPTGWAESSPGICGKECSDGYKLYGGRCYHPKADVTDMIPPYSRKGCAAMGLGPEYQETPLTCYRPPDNKLDTGRAASCPDGWDTTIEGAGGMCQNRSCPTGYFWSGATCWPDGADPLRPSKIPRLKGCDQFGSNLRDDGTSCYRKVYWKDECVDWGLYWTGCAAGGEMVASVTDREFCDKGYTHVAGSCTAYSRAKDVKSIIEVGTCPSGQTKAPGTGICYDDCTDGYYRTTNGSCFRGADTKERPTYCKEGYSDNGAGCTIVSKPGTQEVKSKVEIGTCPTGKSLSDGLCYSDCPSGYYRSAVGSCQRNLQSKERDAYCKEGYSDNGAGCTIVSKPGTQEIKSKIEVGSCDSDRDRVDGRCYKRCNDASWGGGPSFHRTIGGICQLDALSVPRETKDRGAGQGVYKTKITTDDYIRQPTGAASYKLSMKERAPPIPPTTKADFDNSVLGSRVMTGIRAAADGDLQGLATATAGAMMVGNPTVVGLGAQDLVSLYAPGGTQTNSLVS